MHNMKRCRSILLFTLLLVFFLTGYSEADVMKGDIMADLPEGSEQVSFVELGSVKCIPCKKMKPILSAIEREYAGKVKVVFHDVWTQEGKAYGKIYKVRLIPTQVFIDKEGNEIFRNEGFLSQEAIGKVLEDAGVSR